MKLLQSSLRAACGLAAGVCLIALAQAAEVKVHLSGDSEVPPVKTAASGEAMLNVGADGSLSGSVTTQGFDAMMAHVHKGAAGMNGPVIIKLEKEGALFKVPAGTKLDEAQMKAWKAGELYINVHSADHQGGEIRGQIK